MKALLVSAGFVLLATGAASAQDRAPPPDGPRMAPIRRTDVPAMVARHFAELDANHDGGVTEAELRAFGRARFEAMRKAHRDRRFAMLDANRDGSLSKQEFDAPPPPPGGGPGSDAKRGDMPPPPPGGAHGPGPMGWMMMGRGAFEQADANKDGKVTLAEAQAFALATFDRADTNHDGLVDREEMSGLMMAHMRDRPGPRGQGDPRDDMPPPPQ